ncbi:MAG: hypothetical protein QOH90_2245, partial [Actinomycetota bacterium]|nr:hypothetical protein [Actinomycetota bacterium]
ANASDDTVAHIDPRAGTVVDRIELNSGGSPSGIAVTENAVWVAVHER